MFKELARKIFWYLPTKRDQIGYRKDELASILKEKTEAMQKMVKLSEISGTIQRKLEETLSPEQHRLYMDLKTSHQEEVFWRNRLDYSAEREKEIPKEIKELSI